MGHLLTEGMRWLANAARAWPSYSGRLATGCCGEILRADSTYRYLTKEIEKYVSHVVYDAMKKAVKIDWVV